MAIKLLSAKEAATLNGIKILVYGQAGAGKTVFCTTSSPDEKTLIISAEAGLLSILEVPPEHVDVCLVHTMTDLAEIFSLLKTNNSYKWVCLDSLSEIAEVVLATEKANTKNPLQAYGALIDQMTALIRGFRDLPVNVVMTAKQERVNDENSNTLLFMPSMPGSKLAQSLPYFFDEVFALRVMNNADGEPERTLQTSRCIQYEAKDRSGRLAPFEYPTLANVADKIRN